MLRHLRGRPDRHPDPYATHLPLLVGIGRGLPIRRVLELGAGEFSTLHLLNRELFPDLEELDSHDDDASWASAVEALAEGDQRLRLHAANTSIAEAVKEVDLEVYDLILIDDSRSEEARARTIREITARRPPGLVMIHDFEIESYRRAAAAFEHRYWFKALNPNCGILWNAAPLEVRGLDRISTIVRRHPWLRPTDTKRWRALTSGVSLRGESRQPGRFMGSGSV
jgi:predicted O-methyltransferase YrrM